jgi:hypothetical protein
MEHIVADAAKVFASLEIFKGNEKEVVGWIARPMRFRNPFSQASSICEGRRRDNDGNVHVGSRAECVAGIGAKNADLVHACAILEASDDTLKERRADTSLDAMEM